MGRRSNASKLAENLNTQPETNPTEERVESQPDIINQPVEGTDLQPKKASSKKSMTKPKTFARRSGRVQNAGTSAPNRNQPVNEEITVSESEEGEASGDHEEEKLPEPAQNEKTTEEKFDRLVKLIEAQEKTIEELKSKAPEADTRYKSLYIDSQKKIEVLTEENRQLALKLEHARGKIEVYEMWSHGILSKSADAGINNTQAVCNGHPTTSNEPDETTVNAVKKRRVDGNN